MADHDVDLFVIGAGSGGVRAARIASGHGARVMVAEEYRVGGTCVIRGCVPKKLLVYASRFADEFEDAAGYGWTVGEPVFDWATLIANKDREIARLEAAYTTNLERAKVAIVEKPCGDRRMPNTVRLVATGETVRAGTILIATGGAPHLGAEIAGLEHVISSNEAFHLQELPKRVLIQGGGYIAVEFANIFSGLGSEVTLVYRGEQILRGFDNDVRDHLAAEMGKRGIKIVCKQTVDAIEKVEHGLDVELSDRESLCRRLRDVRDRPQAERRRGSDSTRRGVTLAKGAIAVDEFSRTSVPNIYAVGDVTDRINLTPVAIREGSRVCRHRVRRQADQGRPCRCADGGVLRAGAGRHRSDRDAGRRALSARRRLQDLVPADEGDTRRPRHPLVLQADRRRRLRPRAGLPYRRARTPAR